MDAPPVRYVKNGETNIAYSVVGDGPFDLVLVIGWVISALEIAWEGPPGEVFERLSRFCRLIVFDKRGTGLSDRVHGIPDLETRMEDVRAVMDAVGSERAAIMGVSEGGFMTALFAATYPERTAAAIFYGTGARYLKADDYPWGSTRDGYVRWLEKLERRWGDPDYFDELLAWFAPSMVSSLDDATRRWWHRWLRTSVSPGAAADLQRMNMTLDVRDVLPTIRVPTLVLHAENDGVLDVAGGRYIADHIPNAELVTYPSEDHVWFSPASRDRVTAEVERFLTSIWDRGEWEETDPERVLATVLFTDIVGSTEKAFELGDARWRELLEQHNSIVRRQLARFRGAEISTAGDGFLASFDGPARAIRCACEISDAVRALGVDVRAGLHTGECDVLDGKVGGIAVHIGARVAAHAVAGEVLVSSTVKDLVAGSGIHFSDRGAAELKGIPGEWRLYAVETGATATAPPAA